MSEWISTKDGVPKHYNTVLVIRNHPKPECEMGWFNPVAGWTVVDADGHTHKVQPVDYWQERPNPPTEESQ